MFYERQQNESGHKLRTIIISTSRFFLVMLALSASMTSTAAVAKDAHVYRVEVDAALRRLGVTATFGTPVTDIAARSRRAAQFLEEPRNCDDDSPIRVRGRRRGTSGLVGIRRGRAGGPA